MNLLSALLKRYWLQLAFILLMAGAFIAGNVWSDRGWQKNGQIATALNPLRKSTPRPPPVLLNRAALLPVMRL
ncbi:hypothetical protein STBHUCCB_20140 [Salmonella enterica subsp. enterica serovar Typhi str. P-stx-12]|nr:hypothetical protein STBHUCCB_20140 [Salmonella enterica subsp. enterica serovar Typhi str. P-stx-12]ETZ16262.1 hypothetical protein AA09_23335 [Salmonella enterica subsp. enterica serovar Typhi str. STH2370]CGX60878.1 exported phage protein [Salmonella enterica subsp. enterica serovar Typhi]